VTTGGQLLPTYSKSSARDAQLGLTGSLQLQAPSSDAGTMCMADRAVSIEHGLEMVLVCSSHPSYCRPIADVTRPVSLTAAGQCCTADMACQPQLIRPCVAHHCHNDISLSHHLNLLLHLHERRMSCWMHNKAVYCFTNSCCSICVRLQRSENVPVVIK
jgi:hypothetical protein